MENQNVIRNTSLLLAFAAGFCDTVTFVAAGELFSAHVTGNFIVFAYDLIRHADPHSWRKLLSFPLFILSIMVGGRIAKRSSNKFLLLVLESILLMIAGILSIVLNVGQGSVWQLQLISALIIIGMAFQNTFGKLNSKATYGLTTVMTGNVTQASLDLVTGITDKNSSSESWSSFGKQTVLIFGFLVGCLTGALIARQIGLASVLLPGGLLFGWLIVGKRFTTQADQ
ncbi:DUF1275 domain-containing protein [Mucilaginibacter terrenus]|uniref:DUF1275 domain-containing protein n=1 Tax=Mucilaginibacter terrenus TaxID=2482727 RepID=A0A3E2NW63_9SPHI|nr:YoaK family protein [Mucilaginibacter terrenus]RFZ85253.1 DUF1275 domain-containing protein [Mucilaginibacter terrenus]